MATTIGQQVALDEALVPSIKRLRIGRSNFRLPSDIQSKESTLQVVYYVLRSCPFFKAFLVTANKHRLCISDLGNFMYQVEHKNQKKSNEMYYPRFTKVVSRHQNTQQYGAVLPIELTNEEIRNTTAYKEYYACATREAAPKPKASARRKRSGSDTSITPSSAITTPITTGAVTPRLTAAAKGKQPAKAKSPSDPSKLARTEAQQLKIVLRRSRHETHISQHGGFGTDEGTGSKPGVLDVPSDDSEEEISWNSSDDEETDTQEQDRHDDEGDEKDESDDGKEDDDDDKDGDESDDDDKNDDDDEEEIAKIDVHDDTKRGGDDDEESENDEDSDDEETREEESFDPISRTPKDSKDDGNGEENQGLRISEEERIHEEEEADELYRDVDINQGRGLQVSQDIEDSYVTLPPVHPDGQPESSSVSSQFVTSMLNPTSDVGMESIFTTASSLVAPLPTPIPTMTPSIITTITTASHPPIPPTPIPSEVLQNLPTFDSVFRFDERLKSLEANFSEYRQTNPFSKAVSNILDRLRDSYQRENDEFLRTIDDNMKRIIKEQVKSQVKEQVSRILPRIEESVNAQLKAKVLTRSSHSSQTSYVVAADLLKMELKKILIEKMEGNKSIQRSDKQRNLYKALVDAYEAVKTILVSYGKTAILKRRRKDDDDQEGPSAGSDQGSKRRREGGEPESACAPLEPTTRSACRSTTGSKSRQASASESAFVEAPVQTTSQHPEWFPQPKKPLTPDRDWNKTLPAAQLSTQLWISDLAKQADSRSSFNELLDTSLDFSNFIMNRLGVDILTPELLAGPTYELMRGSCNSLTELEYHLEKVYKAMTDQLDWVNPKGQQYPHNLLHPLLLILDNRGRHVIPFAHFINNDLEYLWGGASSQKYTIYVTKTKAADYGHIKWIEDLVPRTMWIQEPINYDKHALWGVSHWGWKRQQFYGFAVNQESALDVYSKRRIIAVTDLKIVEWHNYKHLDWISDVYKVYRHLAAYERSSTGSQKLPEEAQPYQARHIVTHWFTYIVLSALRRSDNGNTLSLTNLILRSILTDLQVAPTKPG
nr:hypothetical protein [Tanacetum cinerariifolium]